MDYLWCRANPKKAAAEIARLQGALKIVRDIIAAEGLDKIIEMNQPDYKRTIVASVDGL